MKKKTAITVLGYGSQGRAIALNLRDSGYKVTVGLRTVSKRGRRLAGLDRMNIDSFKNAVAEADVVIVALPDHVHKQVFRDHIHGYLNETASLVFLHGSSVYFGMVDLPFDNPVLLLAPHAPGNAVRSNYVNNIPFSAFCAVHQGQQKPGYALLTALAKAIGIPRTHLVKTIFANEAIGDVFGEQAVLCGGLARLVKYGFETLVEAGLPPQNAYLEVAYQLDLIVDLIRRYGLSGMFDRISPLARYGSAVNGPQVITPQVRRNMQKVFDSIASGDFIRKGEKVKLVPTEKQMEKMTNISFDRQAKRFAPKE